MINVSHLFSDTRQDEDEQSGSRGDRITTTSLIKFRPTSADDDITWACEAEHPALLNPPLRTAVLLSVQRKFIYIEIISFYIDDNKYKNNVCIFYVCVIYINVNEPPFDDSDTTTQKEHC